MKKTHLFILIGFLFMNLQCSQEVDERSSIQILPHPVKLTKTKGYFKVSSKNTIWFQTGSDEQKTLAVLLKDMLEVPTGYKFELQNFEGDKTPAKGIVLLQNDDPDYIKEGYRLNVTPDRILISASEGNGLFYGIQSLRQLLPSEIESFSMAENVDWKVPVVDIIDFPRFSWRGMHLDVSRHFFPKEFIKRYIDLIAFHKMNVFHWHLVDDQGWRIEIKEYPKLTEIGAWRVDRSDQPWNGRTPQQEGEKTEYGGFYTQEDIKEIVAYAKQRYVTIVPEIEMPAHTTAALVAYPEYSCTGGPFTVPPGGLWPIEDIFCAGKESTFEFLENILKEVMDLFPGEYIHIGGDEATKTEWEQCPECQKRMVDENLESEEELQSYFIQRMEKFLAEHDRKLIGWDEILEGGLAPEATVMSWRGMEGGIEAARMGHDVVMTPGSHCYFDHYQADPATEPTAIGGYTTLKKVYSFNPVPESLISNEVKHILGAQANLWTEYVTEGSHAEYMVLPRMTALSEVVWSPESSRDWERFSTAVINLYPRFDIIGWNYSEGSNQVAMSVRYNPETNKVQASLSSEQVDPVIYYTLDGSDPDTDSEIYKEPFELDETRVIKAAILRDGEVSGNISTQMVFIHLAAGKQVKYLSEYSPKYSAGGNFALVDGIKGSKNYSDERWQGFEGSDLNIIIDLGVLKDFSEISLGALQRNPSWIFMPRWVEFAISNDGENFETLGKINNDIADREGGTLVKEFKFKGSDLKARYIRVKASNIGNCPPWHQGAGGKAWIFLDEIIVE